MSFILPPRYATKIEMIDAVPSLALASWLGGLLIQVPLLII
jgi:hypothetical protein